MAIEIGHIDAIYRYPVKSMRGEQLDNAKLGWHGIDGDRRLAFRRVDERGGNPWLSAGRLPDLLSFTPTRQQDNVDGLPTHARSPECEELSLFGAALAAEIGRRHGAPVQMMQLQHGIFDEASISIIASATAREIGRLSATPTDVRRFRPNIVVRSTRDIPFEEDQWVGGMLTFGETDDVPTVTVTMRDQRCTMVNINPDDGSHSPEVMKACVRANENHAGVYCTVTRAGPLFVGQKVFCTGNGRRPQQRSGD